MYLNIYDMDLNRVGALQTWVSLTWKEEYNGLGNLIVEVVQTSDMVELLRPWRYVSTDKSDQVMLILSVQLKDGHLTAYGKSAGVILERRISNAVIANVNAESAMLSLVQNMAQWPGIMNGFPKGITDIFTSQISGKSVYKYFETISKACDIGFKVLKLGSSGELTDENGAPLVGSDGSTLTIYEIGKNLKVVCYKPGLNKNAKYSLDYGNLSDVVFSSSDMNFYNVAFVAGAGEGADRITVYAGATDKTGIERLEMFVDARDIQQEDGESISQYEARLVARGEEKLLEQAHIESVTFDIDDERAELGDIVTVLLPEFGLSKKVRITSRTITSEYNKEKVTLGVGEPIL